MGPKRGSPALSATPLVRFRTKRSCGTNGKPVLKRRARGPGLKPKTVRKVRTAWNRTDESIESRRVVQAAKRSAFRLQTKSYGLTFSDASGISSKEHIHEFLQSLMGVHFCCVSHELHENAESHYHVAGQLDNRVDITDCHHFDYTNELGDVYHPNIVKGGPAWLSYCKKGHDFVSTYPNKPNVMASALALPCTENALDHIMEHDASTYVRFATSIEANLRRHFKRVNPARVPRWYGPYPPLRYPPNWNHNTHALHLWGPPGSGKTCFAQHLLREVTGGDVEYCKCHVDALKGLSMTKAFVFDEAMFLTSPGSVSREITDVVSGGTVDARYHAIQIPPGIPRIFVSNQRWVFKNPDESVYERRLIQYEMPHSCPVEEWRQYNCLNPPRSPTPPPPPPGTPPRTPRSPPGPPTSPYPYPDADRVVDNAFLDEVIVVPEGDQEFFTRMREFPSMSERWHMDEEGYMFRRPLALAIGAAPLPMTPPVPPPATPLWSPGWSPLLPFEDVYDMDCDPFMNDDTLVHRDDL